jgi:hypothetical protein
MCYFFNHRDHSIAEQDVLARLFCVRVHHVYWKQRFPTIIDIWYGGALDLERIQQ